MKNSAKELQALCAELYQILGVYDAPAHILDQLSAAQSGEKLPYESLLPFHGNEYTHHPKKNP
jgi:hypothetical protein